MNITDLAKQAGFDFDDYYDSLTQEQLEHFAELVRQDEREACAKLCEKMSQSTWTFCNFAKAIRARGIE